MPPATALRPTPGPSGPVSPRPLMPEVGRARPIPLMGLRFPARGRADPVPRAPGLPADPRSARPAPRIVLSIQAFPSVAGWQHRATVSWSLWPPQDWAIRRPPQPPSRDVARGLPGPPGNAVGRPRGPWGEDVLAPGVTATDTRRVVAHPVPLLGAPVLGPLASPPLDPCTSDVPTWARREPRVPLNQRHIVDLVQVHWLTGSAAHDAIIHELRTGYATPMSADEIRNGLRRMHLQHCDMAWHLRCWLSKAHHANSDVQHLFDNLWRYLEEIEYTN